MAETLTLEMPQATINELVKNHLRAELVKSLEADKGRLIESLVSSLINTKERRNYEDKSMLDWAIHDMLKDEIRLILKEWIDANRVKIRESFAVALKRKPTALQKIVDAMVEGVSNDYRFTFNVQANQSH